MDDTFTKLATLRTRRPGDPNPFVVGEAAFGNYLNVMSECMQFHIALRAGK